MVSNDKVITSPITVQDIAQCLHKNTLDVGTLCCSADRINPWSLYKPICEWGLPELTEQEKKELNYGWTIASGTQAWSTTTYPSGEPTWIYNVPTPGGPTDYRVLDFNGYNHRTKPYRHPWKIKRITLGQDVSLGGEYTGTARYGSDQRYDVSANTYFEYSITDLPYKNMNISGRWEFNTTEIRNHTEFVGYIKVIVYSTRMKKMKEITKTYTYGDVIMPEHTTENPAHIDFVIPLSMSVSGPYRVAVRAGWTTFNNNILPMKIYKYSGGSSGGYTWMGYNISTFEFTKYGTDGFKITQAQPEAMWTQDSSALTRQLLGPGPLDLVAYIRFSPDNGDSFSGKWTCLPDENGGVIIFDELSRMSQGGYTVTDFYDIYFGYGNYEQSHLAWPKWQEHRAWYALDVSPTGWMEGQTGRPTFVIAPYGYYKAEDFWKLAE